MAAKIVENKIEGLVRVMERDHRDNRGYYRRCCNYRVTTVGWQLGRLRLVGSESKLKGWM